MILSRLPRLCAVALMLACGVLAGGVKAVWAASPTTPAGFTTMPPVGAAEAASDYRIGPSDKLDVTVFGVKDLSFEKVQVDASGQILLPLIGSVTAQGKTTSQLSAEIAQKLGAKYMQSPQVSVVVAEAVGQKVSIEGAVTEPGVFDMKGRTSLLEAVAYAKGPTRDANLTKVAILRNVGGTVRAATFNYQEIAMGRAGNPEVLGGDVIVVADSKAKEFWHQTIQVLPALSVLALFH